MSTKQTEALKLALEALEECRRDPRLKYEHPYYDKAITAIREALADHIGDANKMVEQPAQQQEPVAVYVGETWCGSVVSLYEELPLETPLYASPQPSKPWVGLTKEDRYKAIRPLYCDDATAALAACHSNDEYEAIEAKLREKNT